MAALGSKCVLLELLDNDARANLWKLIDSAQNRVRATDRIFKERSLCLPFTEPLGAL